ncbi:MAG: response regulator receiver domain [Halobacteriota archaeon]
MSGFIIPKSVIKGYLNSFVFVDDRITQEFVGEVVSTEENEIIESETEEFEDIVVPATPSEERKHTKEYDVYLSQEVYDSISEGGYLCDLFKFEKSKLKQCKEICKNSDVVILDWELSRDEGHQSALEIIKSLYEENGLRFTYIYTVIKDINSIKSEIERFLDVPCIGDYSDFHVDSLYFFVRSKDSDEGVKPQDILESVLGAISEKYKGLMSTFVLDFASTIKKQLPVVLKRYDERIDSSIINLMAGMNEEYFYRIFSQIILSDLEYAILSKITSSPVINKTGISEFLRDSKFMRELVAAIDSKNDEKMKELGGNVLRLLVAVFQKNCCISSSKDIISDPKKFSEILKGSLEEVILPKKIEGLKKENILYPATAPSQLFPILCYLSLYDSEKEIDECADNLVEAHKRFQCLLNTVRKEASASSLTQGTILKDGDTYYLCITPLCDIVRPKKIENRYMFMLGKGISEEEVASVNRDRNGLSIIYDGASSVTIRWNLFDIISLKITDNELNKPVKVKTVDNLEEDRDSEEKELHFVGQLRLDYTLSLLYLGLARLGRVGIETDEVIRLRSEK